MLYLNNPFLRAEGIIANFNRMSFLAHQHIKTDSWKKYLESNEEYCDLKKNIEDQKKTIKTSGQPEEQLNIPHLPHQIK
jgi:hypothetical protein